MDKGTPMRTPIILDQFTDEKIAELLTEYRRICIANSSSDYDAIAEVKADPHEAAWEFLDLACESKGSDLTDDERDILWDAFLGEWA